MFLVKNISNFVCNQTNFVKALYKQYKPQGEIEKFICYQNQQKNTNIKRQFHTRCTYQSYCTTNYPTQLIPKVRSHVPHALCGQAASPGSPAQGLQQDTCLSPFRLQFLVYLKGIVCFNTSFY